MSNRIFDKARRKLEQLNARQNPVAPQRTYQHNRQGGWLSRMAGEFNAMTATQDPSNYGHLGNFDGPNPWPSLPVEGEGNLGAGASDLVRRGSEATAEDRRAEMGNLPYFGPQPGAPGFEVGVQQFGRGEQPSQGPSPAVQPPAASALPASRPPTALNPQHTASMPLRTPGAVPQGSGQGSLPQAALSHQYSQPPGGGQALSQRNWDDFKAARGPGSTQSGDEMRRARAFWQQHQQHMLNKRAGGALGGYQQQAGPYYGHQDNFYDTAHLQNPYATGAIDPGYIEGISGALQSRADQQRERDAYTRRQAQAPALLGHFAPDSVGAYVEGNGEGALKRLPEKAEIRPATDFSGYVAELGRQHGLLGPAGPAAQMGQDPEAEAFAQRVAMFQLANGITNPEQAVQMMFAQAQQEQQNAGVAGTASASAPAGTSQTGGRRFHWEPNVLKAEIPNLSDEQADALAKYQMDASDVAEIRSDMNSGASFRDIMATIEALSTP